MSKTLDEKQNFLLGCTAAFIEGVLLQPTLYWKNALAQNLPFTFDPRKLYRGTSISILNECQMMGLQFFLTGYFHNFFQTQSGAIEGKHKLSEREEVLSSICGGAIAALSTSPLELIMIQQQKFGGSIYTTLRGVVKSHGCSQFGLYRGLFPAALRDAIYVSGMLAVTPIIQKYLTSSELGFDMSQSAASVCASIIGGVLGAVPSHPLDVVKTNMQGDLNCKKSMVQTAVTLAREAGGGVNGIRRLFKGCLFRTINITGTVYIANECNNRLSPYFSKISI